MDFPTLFHVLQLVKSLPFSYVNDENGPLRTEPPRIVHYREYHVPRGSDFVSIKSVGWIDR